MRSKLSKSGHVHRGHCTVRSQLKKNISRGRQGPGSRGWGSGARLLYKNFLSADKHCYDIGQNDTISKIKLFPSSDLSTRDQNCHDNIQLFRQQFEKFSVYCITNWHYKVLGTKQTSE